MDAADPKEPSDNLDSNDIPDSTHEQNEGAIGFSISSANPSTSNFFLLISLWMT